jgi:NAD(P)-dependent dehydrogenase (short-subunit alcohol dehydrogenase family)
LASLPSFFALLSWGGWYENHIFKLLKIRVGQVNPELQQLFSLHGKAALVTGAVGLIGAEVCRTFAKAGASVALADVADATRIKGMAKELAAISGQEALGVSVDISDRDSVSRMVALSVEKFGKIDVLVNCAAIDAKFDDMKSSVSSAFLESYPEELWRKSVDVNVTGLFLVTQAALSEMLKKGKGNIINVASTYSLVSPDPGLYGDKNASGYLPKPVDYVVTKSVVPNFTRYLAAYYSDKGIRSNTVVPHGVYTNHSEEFQERFNRRSPMGRMSRLGELAGPFLFLASDASSYMTGSTLLVDGGWTAW